MWDVISRVSSEFSLDIFFPGFQVSVYIVSSSSYLYAKHLGGGATFSGLVIGIPTLCSAVALIPLMQIDQGELFPKYTDPLLKALYRWLQTTFAHLLLYRYPRPHHICACIQSTLSLPDSNRQNYNRRLAYILDVREEILFGL